MIVFDAAPPRLAGLCFVHCFWAFSENVSEKIGLSGKQKIEIIRPSLLPSNMVATKGHFLNALCDPFVGELNMKYGQALQSRFEDEEGNFYEAQR